MTTNTQSSAALESAVDRSRDQHIAAVNAGDMDTAAAQFAPDGVFLPPGAPALKGAAIRGWFTQVFGMFRLHGFCLQPAEVELSGNLAIEHGTWSATFQPKNGSPALAGSGTYLTVYAQQPDGSVLMIRDTFNGMPG
jgi:ketosteroid isomerase-like protein